MARPLSSMRRARFRAKASASTTALPDVSSGVLPCIGFPDPYRHARGASLALHRASAIIGADMLGRQIHLRYVAVMTKTPLLHKRPKARLTLMPLRCTAAALALVLLAGCAGETGIPFLPSSTPPSPRPPPDLPLLLPPPRDRESVKPLLTPDAQK